MMLSIYLDLKSGETKINKETITAYGLLDSYFEECFLYRYVESSLNPGMWDKKNLHNRIKRQWNNAQHQDEYDEIISLKLSKYKKIKEFLINNGSRDRFFENEVNKGLDNPTLLTLAHLGILQKVTKHSDSTENNCYVWGHEIYQEYFESIYLADQLREVFKEPLLLIIKNNVDPTCLTPTEIERYNALFISEDFIPAINKLESILYRLGNYGTDNQDYRITQYLVEQLNLKKEDKEYLNYLFDFVEMNEFKGDYINPRLRSFSGAKDNILRVITLLCCLSGLGFPDKQTTILRNTFYNCKTLKSVKIPPNIITIENNAFCYCTALNDIELPNTIEQIGSCAFEGCVSLKEVTISSNITKIGDSAFEGCVSLKKVVILNNITEIGNYAFWGCKGLVSINLPDTLECIGNYAFYRCDSLREINISKNVKKLGEGAFIYCDSLKKVNMAHGLQINAIAERSFMGCKKLAEINLPKNITEIGSFAFFDCKSLKHIDLPQKLESIGKAVFAGCSIEEIALPNRIRSIGCGAFNFSSNSMVHEVRCVSDSTRNTSLRWLYLDNNEDYYTEENIEYTVEDQMPDVLNGYKNKHSQNTLKKLLFPHIKGWAIVFCGPFYYYKWDKKRKKLNGYGYNRFGIKSNWASWQASRWEQLHLFSINYLNNYEKRSNMKFSFLNSDDINFNVSPYLFKVSSDLLADLQTAAKLLANKYCNYQWIKME